jgi:hypothetical protein
MLSAKILLMVGVKKSPQHLVFAQSRCFDKIDGIDQRLEPVHSMTLFDVLPKLMNPRDFHWQALGDVRIRSSLGKAKKPFNHVKVWQMAFVAAVVE